MKIDYLCRNPFIFPSVVIEPAERQLGGGEPSLAGPDSDPDVAKPDPSGADHGKQGPVSCGAEAIHVRHQHHHYTSAYVP